MAFGDGRDFVAALINIELASVANQARAQCHPLRASLQGSPPRAQSAAVEGASTRSIAR